MSGHRVARCDFKNPDVFEKYQCSRCELLLKDAVQSPLCGHWLCESCAFELLEAEPSPKCPKAGCLKAYAKEGAKYFPDRCVRREIEELIVSCSNRLKGCQWEDRLVKLDDHQKSCSFAILGCQHCREVLPVDQIESHKLMCPKVLMICPLAEFGCHFSKPVTREDLKRHVSIHGLEHVEVMADVLKLLSREKPGATSDSSGATLRLNAGDWPRKPDLRRSWKFNSQDSIHKEEILNLELDGPPQEECAKLDQFSRKDVKCAMVCPSFTRPTNQTFDDNHNAGASLLEKDLCEGQAINSSLESEFKHVKEDRHNGQEEVATLQEALQSRNDKNGARILSAEELTFDGTFMWKIDNISQRMVDAQKGKYPTEQSKPFYVYDYKMCLEIHILGDGNGKNTHMSLFLVIMKGEFDNVLQWPFTSKVTFKLINQTGNRDIIDTFQPDPMSSSFQKPKSDMNIASGCPRFVSHTELKSGGFLVNDMVTIEFSIS